MPKTRFEPNMTARQLVTALLVLMVTLVSGGVIMAGAALPFVATSATAANAVTKIFDDLPTNIDFDKPSQVSIMLAADGTPLARFYAENRIVVASDQISPLIKEAAVAIEDERFYQHRGIDAQGILGAAVKTLAGDGVSGGSTITQQFVKNTLLEKGRIEGSEALIDAATERTLARKLNEARYAIAVEKKMTKDQILTGYLNVAQFGPSQYGVEAASRFFFNKHAKDVSLPQAAMLAGITQAPARWDPIRHPENAKHRRDIVLGQMYKLNMITKQQFEQAVAVPIKDMLDVQPSSNGCATAGSAAYFCESTVKAVLRSGLLGKTLAESTARLYRGGIVIHTTLDPKKQADAVTALENHIPAEDPSNIDAAMTAVEPNTGAIVAMAQNTPYGNATDKHPDATTINLNVGTSLGGGNGFQTGSTFKIFTLLEWLKTGHSTSELINSNAGLFPRKVWNIPCNPGLAADYKVQNLEGAGGGMMTVRRSTQMSVNGSFVRMASMLNLCNIVGNAEKLGITRGNGDPLEPNPAAVLGSNPLTPVEFAGAMAAIAAEGNFCEPSYFTKIEDRAGHVLATNPPRCRQVFDKNLMRKLTTELSYVVTPGSTGENAILPGHRPVAGKTGTANADANAWFVGFTPQLAMASWVGHKDATISMFDSVVKGKYYDQVYGGLFPALIFHDFMSAALKDAPVLQFTPPSNLPTSPTDGSTIEPPKPVDPNDKSADTQLRDPVTVPDAEGYLPKDAETILRQAGLAVQIGTPQHCKWQRGVVCGTSPGTGTQVERGTTITLHLSLGPK